MSQFIQPRIPAPTQGYSWPHRIEGRAQQEGAGTRKRITVMEREGLTLTTTLVSNSNGSFLFRGLPALPAGHSGWMVIVQDNILSDEDGLQGDPIDGAEDGAEDAPADETASEAAAASEH